MFLTRVAELSVPPTRAAGRSPILALPSFGSWLVDDLTSEAATGYMNRVLALLCFAEETTLPICKLENMLFGLVRGALKLQLFLSRL